MEWIIFVVLGALILGGVPIAVSLLAACITFLLVTDLRGLEVVPQRIAVSLDSFPLLAIPMFILMGFILEKANLSRLLIDWLAKLVGHVRGGLGIVTILACAMLAALTGSGPATVVAVGSIMIPAMVSRGGYTDRDSVGLVTVAGSLGPIIPPSIIMIIYGATMNLSISSMFMGAIVPGLVLMIALVIWNAFKAPVKDERSSSTVVTQRQSAGIIKLTLRALPIIVVPVVVIGGIYSGVFTPTESAAAGVVMSSLVGLLYRKLSMSIVLDALRSTALTSGLIGILIGVAGVLGWILAVTQLPARLASSLVPAISGETQYILLLLAVLFLVGCIMEPSASVVILAPILVPIGISLGLDPLHLGVLFCIALVVGYVTPPFGLNLFTGVSISGLPYGSVVRGALQPMLVFIGVVLLIALVPSLVTWLPGIVP